MKNIYLIAILSLFLFGCSQTEPKVAENPMEKKTATDQQKDLEPVAAHSTEKEKDAETVAPTNKDASQMVEKSDKPKKWSRGGVSIDVSNQTKTIAETEKSLKAKPDDITLKKNLAQAYTKRGVILSSSKQYAAALGDFRSALKYDADNQIAKNWINQITTIYKGMNIEAPKEGEEPEPLEFKKEKA